MNDAEITAKFAETLMSFGVPLDDDMLDELRAMYALHVLYGNKTPAQAFGGALWQVLDGTGPQEMMQ